MGLACDEVIPRLVAWQDGELSRSEAVQVEEHVARCRACARVHHRLARTLPLPPPRPPAEVRRRLAQALDVDAILAAAAAPEPDEAAPEIPPSWPARVWRGFARPSPVPFGVVLVYLALLAATFGWGASNWWALRQAAPPAVTAAPPRPTGAIPASQFRPAAYDPGADGSAVGRSPGEDTPE